MTLDDEDPELEALLARARREPPPGLEAAILAAVRDPARARRYQWEDLAAAARVALWPSALALAASLALAATLLGSSASSEGVSEAAALYGNPSALDRATWLLEGP